MLRCALFSGYLPVAHVKGYFIHYICIELLRGALHRDTMATNDMFLYWGSGSAPCWKVIIVLAEKGLWDTCPQKLCEFSKKEHKGDDVLKLNPRGQVSI